jgi:hypothetical protein
MAYRKFLFILILLASALFAVTTYGALEWLLPAISNNTLSPWADNAIITLILAGIAFNLIPFLCTGLVVAPLSLGPVIGIPIAAAFYLLYITGLIHLLTRKYRPQAPFSHPLGLSGMKKRLLLLFLLMILMGLGWMGLASE